MKNMDKPNNPKCNTCFVKHNILRCWNCRYKTDEWLKQNLNHPIMMIGENDLYKSKTESEE